MVASGSTSLPFGSTCHDNINTFLPAFEPMGMTGQHSNALHENQQPGLADYAGAFQAQLDNTQDLFGSSLDFSLNEPLSGSSDFPAFQYPPLPTPVDLAAHTSARTPARANLHIKMASPEARDERPIEHRRDILLKLEICVSAEPGTNSPEYCIRVPKTKSVKKLGSRGGRTVLDLTLEVLGATSGKALMFACRECSIRESSPTAGLSMIDFVAKEDLINVKRGKSTIAFRFHCLPGHHGTMDQEYRLSAVISDRDQILARHAFPNWLKVLSRVHRRRSVSPAITPKGIEAPTFTESPVNSADSQINIMNPRTYNGSPFETFAGGDQQSLSSLAQIPCARVSTPIPSDTVESEVAGQQGPLQTSAAPVDDVAVDVPVLSRVNPRRGLTSGGDEIDLIVTNLPPSITLYARFGCNITPTTQIAPGVLFCLLPPAAHPGMVNVTLCQAPSIDAGSYGKSFASFEYEADSTKAVFLLFKLLNGKFLLESMPLIQRLLQRDAGSLGLEVEPGSLRSSLPESGFLDVLSALKPLAEFPRLLATVNEQGQTLLHLAVHLRYRELVQKLIHWGIDPNVRDINGFTALHAAYLCDDPFVVGFLEAEGASPFVLDELGRLPTELAAPISSANGTTNWRDEQVVPLAVEEAAFGPAAEKGHSSETLPPVGSSDLFHRSTHVPTTPTVIEEQLIRVNASHALPLRNRARTEHLIYLDKITVQGVLNRYYKLRLFMDYEELNLQTQDNQAWTPAQRPGVSPTSEMRAEIEMTSGNVLRAKNLLASEVIDLQMLFNNYWNSNEHKFTQSAEDIITNGKHHHHRWYIELHFSASTTTESLRPSLHKLEGLLKDYYPPMDGSTERTMEKAIKYGAVFSELNPISKAIFTVAKVTFELLNEQTKYGQTLPGLLDQLRHMLPFADIVVEAIVCQETDLVEKIIPRTFEVMHRVARVSCDYVKHARTVGGLETVEEIDRELTKVVEDFHCAVNVEDLRRTKETEHELLLGRLKYVKTGYDKDLRCMEGTRKSLLKQIMAWATNESEQTDGRNTYWIYGSPGIGKTSLANSICASLHDQKQLAGAFFCRRDDSELSEPNNIFSTLIHKLAITFPAFRSVVAEHLRKDQNVTPKSMKYTLFLDSILALPRLPSRTLIFVIDALDECDNARSRPDILKALTGAATHAPWLRVIITSRPEVDIQRFFDSPAHLSHLRYDLTADKEATSDLRIFAQDRFSRVAFMRCLQSPWPEQSLFDGVISRAAGLFTFIEALARSLEYCDNPTELLRATLEDAASTALRSQYGLYSSIVTKARSVHSNAEFRRMIGVLLITAPYRPLSEEAIAELAGVRADLVKMWVRELSSLLCRDEGANGRIRVRHLSISDFFVSEECPRDYRVNLRDANVQLGVACLEKMVGQLRFNICKLEDSRLANDNVKDLPSRIKENISDTLQYSCLHWASHLCSAPDTGDRRVWECLGDFFSGLYPLFWIEVLSIMGMLRIGIRSLRKVTSTLVKDADLLLLDRIQDVRRFMTYFGTPISISAPHTYISTRPFLPFESHLSTTFRTRFTKGIKMKGWKLLSWPAPPLERIGHSDSIYCTSYSPNGCYIVTGSRDKTSRIWDAESDDAIGMPLVGHTDSVRSVAYSPDGQHIISGSDDKTIRIWDAETGFAVGKPLEGHTNSVWSVAYSVDGQHIISGSEDNTIRIWDADTGDPVGDPLEGHTRLVASIACSPDGRHIISGSFDKTVRIWDAETGSTVGKPLEGHAHYVTSVAYSHDGQHIISGSYDKTVRIWNARTGSAIGKPIEVHAPSMASIASSPDGRHTISELTNRAPHMWDQISHDPIQSISSAIQARQPDSDGWVRDPVGGLLYWVPHDCSTATDPPAFLNTPLRSVSLQFEDFAFGTSWTQIFDTPQS